MSDTSPSNGGSIDMAALAAHPEAVLHEPGPTRPLPESPGFDDALDLEVDDEDLVPPPSNPMAVARRLVAERYSDGSTDLLLTWRGGFYRWDGRCWREWEEAAIRAEAYRFLEDAEYMAMTSTGPERRRWEPTRSKIANVIEALRAVTHLAETIQPPAWLDGQGPDPHDLVVTENGVLHVPTRQLLPHDPRLFVTHAVPFAYQADAPSPTRWLGFLRDLWGDDAASTALGQEMAGYTVSGDTSLQKILLLVGPREPARASSRTSSPRSSAGPTWGLRRSPG